MARDSRVERASSRVGPENTAPTGTPERGPAPVAARTHSDASAWAQRDGARPAAPRVWLECLRRWGHGADTPVLAGTG
ncbi:hypothetical protein BJF83_00020 [Nocardiopsis sp. CNR-923]|nr:hypothetical protein BJF83_00020 [Nocardiopsis sp. CNR-923]